MQNSSYPFITPSSTCLSEDLLFFDTFSHYGSEEDNFDLVQFPSPVVIDLIKIVPLGQPVEAKIPGNVRLGATNPSNCELEFFINDLTKQDAHTMTDLGKFYCSEKDTDFNPPLQVQTDGLLLRGSYRTLTLAIFGQIATYDEKVEDEAPILSAASPPAQTPASPVASERDIPYMVGSVDQELMRRVRDGSDSFEESPLRKSNDVVIKDPLNNENNTQAIDYATIDDLVETDSSNIKDRAGLEDLSNSDGMPPDNCNSSIKKSDDIEYSNSTDLDSNNYSKRKTSKENIDSHTNNNNNNSNNIATDEHPSYDDDDNSSQEAREWTFDVENYQPKPLLYFPDPSLTIQERSIASYKLKISNQSNFDDINSDRKELDKIKEMFDGLNSVGNYKSDDWVTLLEDLHNDIANMSLSQTISNEDMLRFLVKQVSDGLDIELALRQKQTGFKVRHLRAGIKLGTILFHSGEAAIKALLEASIPQKVLKLYDKEQMSLPLRLLIFKCLNAACDSVEGANHLVESLYIWDDSRFTIPNVKKKLIENEQVKRNNTESGESHQSDSTGALKNDSSQSQITELDEDTSQNAFLTNQDMNDKDTLDNSSKQLTCYQYMLLILMSQPTTRVTIAIGNLIKKIRLYQCLKKLSELELQIQDYDDSDSVFQSADKTDKNGELVRQSLIALQDIVNLTKNNCANITQPIRYLPAKVQFRVKTNTNDTYLALYKWLKHFKVLEHINDLFEVLQAYSLDSTSSSRIEQTIRVQNLCLLFLQQLVESPRGAPLLLSGSYCEVTGILIRYLAKKQSPKRLSHVRISDGIESCLNASLIRDEALSASSCNDLSLRMCYHLKIFSCIDKLFHSHRELISKREEPSLCDPEKVLHQLYIMSDHPYGLLAIIKHFSCIGNLDCLLRFLDMPEHHKQLEFVKETSSDYALELIGTFFRLNNNVLEIADEYLDTLIDLCKNKEKTMSVRIRSLLPWLTPFNTDKPLPLITYSDETFRQLTRVIRKSIPNYSIPFANGLNFELPPHMITAVRILRQLCIPPQVESFIESNFDIYSTQKLITNNNLEFSSFSSFSHDPDQVPHELNHNQYWNLNLQSLRNNGQAYNGSIDDPLIEQLTQISNTFRLFQPYDESICGDLKYHYGIMQTFEQEGLKRLLNTLRELVGNYPRPIYQSAALSGFRGRIVISYIHSVVILLHSIVCHLIDARGSEFKDTSLISVVLETYSLLCFVPKPKEDKTKRSNEHPVKHCILALQKSITLQTDNYQMAQQTKKLIISLLMSYTQMCLSVSESEEKVISKSMWTKMLKEVIEFTLSTPVFFHHGLEILTKILPQPLPCSSMMDSIDQEQLFKNINHRKLWSAHLHPLHQQIEQMISQLSICFQPSIKTLIYNFCNQLSDLSSNAACMVAKTITDNLVHFINKLNTEPAASTMTDNSSVSIEQDKLQTIAGNQSEDDRGKNHATSSIYSGKAVNEYAIKMILNLLVNIIANQAFLTAFSNQLQILGKRDEKSLISILNSVKIYSDYKCANDSTVEDCNNSGGANSYMNIVTQITDTIKIINDGNNLSKDGLIVATSDVGPPEELCRINLLDVARKTSDRFPLSTNLKQTYRLKVLLDLQSHAHRTSESSTSSSKRFDHSTPYNYQELSVPSSYKAYVPPLRGRGRPIARPDSFRSRPQNTSRPPSIHVDDFIDLYGDNPGSSSQRYKQVTPKAPLADYRASSRPYPEPSPSVHGGSVGVDMSRVSGTFFNPQIQPPPPHSGSPYSSGSGGSRTQISKGSKYMKMK